MPIRISCQCGKSLNVRDELAGKTVKCPGCGKPIKVAANKPAAAAGGQPAEAKQAAPRAAPAPSNRMNDLFDEEGFSAQVAALCPACRAEMPAGAILCTKCGFNTQTGERLAAHKTPGVDVDHGALALEKAKRDLAADEKMQHDLLTKAGLPWWALALILFCLGSALTIGVLVVNASRRVDESFAFNPLALFFALAGSAFLMVCLGAFMLIVAHAFRQSTTKGVLCLVLPPFYAIYHVFTNFKETWKFFVVSVVMGGIAAGFFVGVANQGGI